MAVTEIELPDLNLDPLAEYSELEDPEIIDSFNWKQLPGEEKQAYDLVVYPAHPTADLKVSKIREIEGRTHLLPAFFANIGGGKTGGPGKQRYSDEELLQELQRLKNRLEKPPSREDINKYGKCSAQTIYTHFGSITKAREQAGVGHPEKANKISKSELIDELNRVAEEVGSAPSIKDIKEIGEYSPGPYWREFGGLQNALVEAGIHSKASDEPTAEDWKEYKKSHGQNGQEGPEYTEEALLREIKTLAEALGRPPRVKDIKEQSKYSYKPYRNRWDDIQEVREAAGVDEVSEDE
ncbi:homing endonuclease associated repeat-containing protein [Halobacterium sp. CBA1126]|uniref:homing endonuclease associated repeat-containing protein n=1 Tax=Halobacterium sp. CBA1126 TaxID=2668074 RepID=UPI0012FBA0CE|nr:hypothetical protein [Halobacterium sp. CBA1126]MUV59766.1 hypothetical protein [Halobacterium sp. CBA1126]